MNSGTGKIIAGVLAGLAVGALLGVIFAPDKGSETRKKMTQKGEDLADEVKEKLNRLLDELNQKIDAAKAKYSDVTNTTAEKVLKIPVKEL